MGKKRALGVPQSRILSQEQEVGSVEGLFVGRHSRRRIRRRRGGLDSDAQGESRHPSTRL